MFNAVGTEPQTSADTPVYARCIEASKRVRWDIERDVIRGRRFDRAERFLPESLARLSHLDFLSDDEQRLLNQIQGRTYANMFGLVERFIGAKMIEVSRTHALGDQVALEALVRFTDEEIKHQALFRRIEALAAEGMPAGYHFAPDPNAVARAVLAASPWAVLALICHIELFTQVHYRQSIEPDDKLSALYKDVFLFHWKEESQHATLDEIEWRREDARLSHEQRNAAVDDLITLVSAVDVILVTQAEADADYFVRACRLADSRHDRVQAALVAAYRWQYIVSGVQSPRFVDTLGALLTAGQSQRIHAALEPLMRA